MGVSIARLATCAAGLALVFASAACQGNIGTGGGLPQPPGPQITAIAGAQSRTRTTDGAVFLASDLKAIPLPDVGGVSVTILPEPPTPAPSGAPSGLVPAPAGSAKAALSSAARPESTRLATATPAATPTAAPTAAPPVAPPSASGSPAPKASGTPAARSALAGGGKPKSAATPSGPKIDTKTTIYPEHAPAAPTPQPTGNVQSYAQRTPLVRGWILSRTPLTLYSLAAVRFTIPPSEQTKGRGYTISLFQSLKHRKNRLIASDPSAVLAADAISAATVATEPISLKKNVGYFFVLYGDYNGPAPAPTGSFPAANNPVLGSPGPGGLPATPIPGVTPFPSPTQVTVPR